MKYKKLVINIAVALCATAMFAGCTYNGNESADVSADYTIAEEADKENENVAELVVSEVTELEPESIEKVAEEDENPDANENITQGNEILEFVDAHGNPYQVEIQPDWKLHEYDMNGFFRDGDRISYASEEDFFTCVPGIDVSYYQGKINWEKVKETGYEFAFVRIGYRGYGQSGKLCADKRYAQNIKGALAVGLDVGVYFFSQAISEEEAVEEAEFVFQLLEDIGVGKDDLTLPIVFDPENILDDEARTDDVTGEQFTKNAIAFCEHVKESGYKPMIYSNMLWEAYKLDLKVLADYPIWYADYEAVPQTPYDFTFWQYSESARVDGISESVDVNVWMKEIP